MLKIIKQEAQLLTIILIYLGQLFNNLKPIIGVQIEFYQKKVTGSLKKKEVFFL